MYLVFTRIPVEPRSFVKVEVAVPNNPTVSVDVKQHSTNAYQMRVTVGDSHTRTHAVAVFV